MKTRILKLTLAALLNVVFATESWGQAPGIITYQGRVQSDGTNFTGTGQFKFALVDAGVNTNRTARATATLSGGRVSAITVTDGGTGYVQTPRVNITGTGFGATAEASVSQGAVTAIRVLNAGSGYTLVPQVRIDSPPVGLGFTTYWSNDGSSVDGGEPGGAVTVSVKEGLFTVRLGDAALANMTVIPAEVFTNSDVRLRLWFSDGAAGFTRLTPDQRLSSVGYAMLAQRAVEVNVDTPQLLDGAVTMEKLGNGAVGGSQLADGAVTSAKIADGTITTNDLTSQVLGAFWRVGGNAGTAPATHFVGTTDDVPLALRANNRRVLQLESEANGGYRIIAGTANTVHTSSTNSVILGGRLNVVEQNAHQASIVAGRDNGIGADQDSSFIGGGARNDILQDNQHAVIVGGRDNRIGTNTVITAILGGGENIFGNNVDGGLIVGGFRNDISGSLDPIFRQIAPVIVGGSDNEIGEGRGSSFSVILGGDGNVIGTNAWGAAILGGRNNDVGNNASNAVALGFRAQANHAGAFVWGDATNEDFPSTATNQFSVRATGGVRLVTGVNISGTPTAGVSLTANDTSWNVISDRAAKKNFQPADGREILEKLSRLPIQRWHYQWEADDAVPHLGPVAQDFKAAFYPGRDDKTISTLEADGVALAAIQGLNQKLEETRAEVKRRDAENAELKARLAALERIVLNLSAKRD